MKLALSFAIALFATGSQSPGIVGSWRGTSLCSDKVAAPACNDEVASYEIRAKGTSRDTVVVDAGKIVAGKREVMSVDDFVRQPDGSWKTEIITPRFKVRIVLRATGDSLTGSLIDLALSKKVRDIALRRQTGG